MDILGESLSKPGVLLLGLVAEGPIGAYEVLGVLKRANARRWLAISEPTVYLTMRNLATRGLIQGTPMRTGRMPEKTVYEVTPAGQSVLAEAVAEFLSGDDRAAFDVATLLLCHLKQEQVVQILDERVRRLELLAEHAKGEIAALEANVAVPFIGPAMVRHNLYAREAELRSTRELLTAVAAEGRWDYFVTRG